MLSTLTATRSLLSSYLRIRSLATSTSSPELIQARKELESNVHHLSSDLEDLGDSVRAVEKDPFRFGLDIEEIGRRRKLVQDVGDELEDMRNELSPSVGGPQYKSSNGSALPPPDTFGLDSPMERDDYGAFEQQRQVEMMHEQDEALDEVYGTVENLRNQANDMGRELEEQGEMLEDVDNLADRVGGKLQGGLSRVGDVIKRNEGEYPPRLLESDV